MQTIRQSETKSEGDQREELERAAEQMVATLPQVFKSVMRQAREQGVAGHPLTHEMGEAQRWTLYALVRGRRMTSELARRFNVTNPTMTRIVDALVDKGYVERCPDVEDRRRVYLEITPAGAKIADHFHEHFQAALVSFLEPLSEEQLEDIVRAFRHLRGLLPEQGAWCGPEKDEGRAGDEGRRTKDGSRRGIRGQGSGEDGSR